MNVLPALVCYVVVILINNPPLHSALRNIIGLVVLGGVFIGAISSIGII